ncbi:ABC transporter permease [Coprococcus comes]|uniref:ABC transporter permease n=1 Tax=Coprococcus comes TaxID=410072 RepID=UPI00156DACFC|nr:ABC transporter permease [Coprococcus comes]
MKKYIAKRMFVSIVTILIILLLLFCMLQFMPGSPFNDEKLSEAQVQVLNQKYGLDQPIVVQFVNYVKNVVKGDFGVSYSISKNTDISKLLNTRLPVSFRIGGQAVVFGAIIGIMLGIAAALKSGTWIDSICTIVSVLGVSLPSYVFALAMAYFLGYRANIFPLLYNSAEAFASSVMPTIALAMFSIATVARFTRTELLEVLDSDYMLLAESKGITGRTLIVRHALRNALIPIITVLAPLVVDLMIGSLVIEKIFSIPGIGSLMVTAIQSNDYNVTITIAFIYSVMYIVLMLAVDILYGVIDPRIRLAKE